jgi:spore germination protein YaaH
MDTEGFIAGEVPPEVAEIAAANHVAVMPLVTNRGFNQPLMHTVLDSEQSRARAIRYMIYYALRDGYLGFQFDYENIHYSYRDKFTVFFREAARAFHKHGLQLSAAVVGRLNDNRNSKSPGGYDNWSGVYDYVEMGKVADFISVMAYAEHGATADPGPVAGLPWVTRIAEYSLSTMPASRISLGVPFYAMRWEATAAADPSPATPQALPQQADPGIAPQQPARKWQGRSARYRDAASVMDTTEVVWDEKENAPHLTFETEGRRTELWFEDVRSLQAKMRLASRTGFRGISAWALGQEDPAFWDSLDEWTILHPHARSMSGTLEERAFKAAALMGR